MSGQPHDALIQDYNGEWADADFSNAQQGEGTTSGAATSQRPAAKVVVSLRLGRDVVDHFRAAGPGWEARMEEALRKTAEAETEAAALAPARESAQDFVSDGHEG